MTAGGEGFRDPTMQTDIFVTTHFGPLAAIPLHAIPDDAARAIVGQYGPLLRERYPRSGCAQYLVGPRALGHMMRTALGEWPTERPLPPGVRLFHLDTSAAAASAELEEPAERAAAVPPGWGDAGRLLLRSPVVVAAVVLALALLAHAVATRYEPVPGLPFSVDRWTGKVHR